ncbi:MAG: hypothetical protein LUF91_03750 [Oscillospiraceae bacterium]|nr:hypothetical protein [Oscillospiraceae bacterium]
MAIGICRIDQDKNILKLERGPLWQGFGFKDADAFENKPDAPCYVPELFDTVYTRNDLLEMCDGQECIAQKIFYQLDWQSPESLLNEELQEGELSVCKNCGRMFESYWSDQCPHCEVRQGSD